MIFNLFNVIKRYSVMSLAKSLKFINKSDWSINVRSKIYLHKAYVPLYLHKFRDVF